MTTQHHQWTSKTTIADSTRSTSMVTISASTESTSSTCGTSHLCIVLRRQRFILGSHISSKNIAHGSDINQKFYIVLSSSEHQALLKHDILTVDTSVIPSDAAGMYQKMHLFQRACTAINYVVTRSAVVPPSDPSHLGWLQFKECDICWSRTSFHHS